MANKTSSPSGRPPIVLKILCDSNRMITRAITCRACGLRQVLNIPGEAYDASLMLLIECPRCDEQYVMIHNQYSKLTAKQKEEYGDRTNETSASGAKKHVNTEHYDA